VDSLKLRIAVLGAGGVGGLLGALLTRIGDSVTVLADGASAATLATRGITVRSSRFGDFGATVAVAPGLEDPVDVCRHSASLRFCG